MDKSITRFPNIDAERARLGLTKTALASELGIERATLAGYVEGVRPIPLNILMKMASMFECSLDYLVGLSDSRDTKTA